jgi:hypothetical protein
VSTARKANQVLIAPCPQSSNPEKTTTAAG